MPSLTIVIPVYNEAERIGPAIRSVEAALAECPDGVDAEVVVVDDGSSDGSGEAAQAAANGLVVRVLVQENQGRFAARRAGLEAAGKEHVLFLDSRVQLLPGSLSHVAGRLDNEEIWNAHVVIDTEDNRYAHFWNVLTELAFAEYFSDPRETTFDAETFDRFPKGTTCFLAPRQLLIDAFEHFTSYYADPRHANDDTSLIRWLAEQRPIHISPRFSCLYSTRTSLRGFLRHAIHRGVVFLDGHGRPESRFFPVVVAFYPVGLVAAAAAARRPVVAPVLLAATGAAAAAVATRAGRSREETIAFATLAPVYAVGHGLGMWKGLGLALAEKARRLGAA